VLLRYLTDAYKTLAQTVPEASRTPEIDDILTNLRTMVRQVDSSLIDEWESLGRGAAPHPTGCDPLGRPTPAEPQKLGRPRDLSDDPRAFAARVRNELHRLLKALADRRWDDAAAALLQREHEWPAARLESEIAPYFAEHPSIDVTPMARRPHNTFLKESGPRIWEARQKIVDPAGEADWAIECLIDLSVPRTEDEPLIELRRIGV
jgi:hypothetical protein